MSAVMDKKYTETMMILKLNQNNFLITKNIKNLNI